jgi:hypothetical protein
VFDDPVGAASIFEECQQAWIGRTFLKSWSDMLEEPP